MAEFNSILQTWTLNLGKCFMTVFMTSKQPTEATNFLLSAKGEKPRAWYIAQDLPGSSSCAQPQKGQAGWEEAVSSLSPHSSDLRGLPQEGEWPG